jgi:hypothetical protein
MSFDITSPATTWYPAVGHFTNHGDPSFMNGNAYYWSVAIAGEYAYSLYFHSGGGVDSMFPAYRSCAFSVRCQKEGTGGGPYESDFPTSGAYDLADSGSANSYIVSSSGTYSIPAVKGNSYEYLGDVASVEVLWESFGTKEIPSKGDLINGIRYEGNDIYFRTSDNFRKGNAGIAAKDESGEILWSWHIWFTDQPEEHIYLNNAGTLMDRNLGATSAMPGDPDAYGLYYQWGRKDPFLNASSTITWPTFVWTSESTGNVDYATQNPMTFIGYDADERDWCWYSNDEMWSAEKTIYDPCPPGWRVPDGGARGTFANLMGGYDSANKGMSFRTDSPSSAWYPAAGHLSYEGLYTISVVPIIPYCSKLIFDIFINLFLSSFCLVLLNRLFPKDPRLSINRPHYTRFHSICIVLICIFLFKFSYPYAIAIYPSPDESSLYSQSYLWYIISIYVESSLRSQIYICNACPY